MEEPNSQDGGPDGFRPVRRRNNGKLKKNRQSPYPTDVSMEDGNGDSTVVLNSVNVEDNAESGLGLAPVEVNLEEDPKFHPLTVKEQTKDGKTVMRRIVVPPHRFSPLKKVWVELVEPLVQHMALQVRMNIGRRCVELRNSPKTTDIMALQKGAEYVKAFMLGFGMEDAIALLRLDDLFVQSFEIKDVKKLTGNHLSRCIGRISGKDGKTKHAIENSTRTRIVLADSQIHILGSHENIRLARNAVCSLILGRPPGKVYQHLRTVARRLQERF
eukprot:GHVU01200857.1.p1 GENE.GHVU01200857.1~~GHVU01200857.1.p1  ORF type:complete len:272 (+),score=27.63 GHVU01200857.1:47-862(+)